jgi:adenosine deaminase
LTDDIEAIKLITKDVIDEFANDGVKYLELRSTPRKYEDTDIQTKNDYVRAVLSVINQPRDDIIVKLILSVDRRNTLDEAMEAVDLAVKYQNEGVVAVDLCGDVHAGSFDTLQPAFLKAQQHGLKVTLHFCEVCVASSSHYFWFSYNVMHVVTGTRKSARGTITVSHWPQSTRACNPIR